MVRSFKSTLIIEFALIVLGYTAFLLFIDFAYANAFLGGFIIIFQLYRVIFNAECI